MTNRADAVDVQSWQIGHRPEPLRFVVTSELNQQYLFAEEDFDPIYLGENGLVHPTLLLSMSNSPKSPSYRLAEGTGGMVAKEVTRFLGHARVGALLIAEWKLVDSYERRGRLYNVIETLLTDEGRGIEILARTIYETYTSPQKGRD